MAVWRREALERFPELAKELTSDDVDSTYAMWREVFLPLVRDAYGRAEEDLLSRIFGYAAWSARQPAEQVWNAVGVSFYEHLFDTSRSDDWMDRVVKLTPPKVADDVWVLWEAGPHRLPRGDLERLRAKLSARPSR